MATINGVDAYAVKTRGNAQSFIRTAVVNSADVSKFDTAETAAASAAGIASANFGGSLVGGTDAGLPTGTFTMSVSLDGTVYPVSISVTSGDAVDTIVTAINVDLPGTECAISGGNLVFTSPTTGLESYVTVTDTDLLAGMTAYTSQVTTSDGLLGQLSGVSLGNGADAAEAYVSAVEVYDTDNAKTVIGSNYAVGNLNATFSDTEVETELGLVKVKLDALQKLVK